ncbi:receptor-interacting serine/threonine-protein kinase 3 [Parambassis ranga]|uniref:Receptor-interacting serine/threonine-protein kinase 3 n=1 Tax=Parambassis ranga TaxID=210632 RepID=A0A6P7IMK0_9TELE|nr:receptor-interacting serine/threonine-protein kinase 3-like [Parambassis ranga]
MARASNPAPTLVGESCLEQLKLIGSGGFGQIYKARHQTWCCDVAIKVLHFDDGSSSSLLHEVEMMRKGSSPYVIQVLGVFQGLLASSGSSVQLGLVMEFMERGSLTFTQDTLKEPLPWPLAFRLTHQVALGMNFLHSLTPPMLHLDLKPSNVLLDGSLNAKLTDFGLARFYHSISRVSKKDSKEEGGTLPYMPPEAFDLSYTPTSASDIYSYGILLWSIVTGKQPYQNAMSSIVRLRIPEGDRPSLDEIKRQAAGCAGLQTLMDLMVRCWDMKSSKRPTSRQCTTVTEELYKMHKRRIRNAVDEVLEKLEQKEEERVAEQFQRVSINHVSVGARADIVNVDRVPTGRPPVQEVAGHWTTSPRDKASVSDSPSPRHASCCQVEQIHSATGHKINPSSVHPIQSLPPSASTRRSSPCRTATKSQHLFQQRFLPQYQRQYSTPDTCTVNIHCSNVTGLQSGNNNSMQIYVREPLERRRHPTAPSTVNHAAPRP